MAGEQQQGMDRRRAIGVMGKASATAAVIGVPAAAAAGTIGGRAPQVDVATVRRELAAGGQSVPMEDILPDDIGRAELARAAQLMDQRIDRVVDMLLEGGRANRAQLIAAKHTMHRARAEVKTIVAGVAEGGLPVADARARARAAFTTYFTEMKAFGAS